MYKLHKPILDGFGLLDSIIALSFFAAITLGILLFNSYDSDIKSARQLALQTEVFATVFAKYISNVYAYTYINSESLANTPQVFSPMTLQSVNAWSKNLAPRNMYQQIPCVVVKRNAYNDKLEALMYYVKSDTSDYNNYFRGNSSIMRIAVNYLGGKGGLFVNNNIIGNAGWNIKTDADLFSQLQQCGGTIVDNSPVVNLDLMPSWNNKAYFPLSILRGQDSANAGILAMPGHRQNGNTLKTNLYFDSGSGIITSGVNGEKFVKLAVNNQANSSDLALYGDNTVSTIISDTIRPQQSLPVGYRCSFEDLGKEAVALKEVEPLKGVEPNSITVPQGDLVCTQNDILCGAGNYCYLPTVSSNVLFQNLKQGIQDQEGKFICPKSVPFATSITTRLGGVNDYFTIVNASGIAPNAIAAVVAKRGLVAVMESYINCSFGCSPAIVSDGKAGLAINEAQLLQIDLANIRGAAAGKVGIDAVAKYDPIVSNIDGYNKVIYGYQLRLADDNLCAEVCPNLTHVVGYNWQQLGTRRQLRLGDGYTVVKSNPQLGCACERSDFSGLNEDHYNGIIVVLGRPQQFILAVNCSNLPLYYTHH